MSTHGTSDFDIADYQAGGVHYNPADPQGTHIQHSHNVAVALQAETDRVTTGLLTASVNAVMKKQPQIIQNANKFLSKVEQLAVFEETIRTQLTDLGIFTLDQLTTPTYQDYISSGILGRMSKMDQYANWDADGTPQPGTWENDADSSGTYNGGHQVLPPEVLRSDAFQTMIYGGSGPPSSTYWPAGWQKLRWGWVPSTSMEARIGEYAIPDNAAADTPSWPYGWLTTLTTVRNMIGFFTYSKPWSAEEANRDQEHWGCFTRMDVDNFSRGNLTEGYNNIMRHNHGNKEGFTPQSFFNYTEGEQACGTVALTTATNYAGAPLAAGQGVGRNRAPGDKILVDSGTPRTVSTTLPGASTMLPVAFSSIFGVLLGGAPWQQLPMSDYQLGPALESQGGLAPFPVARHGRTPWGYTQVCERLVRQGQAFSTYSTLHEGEDSDTYSTLGSILVTTGNTVKTYFDSLYTMSQGIQQAHRNIQKELCTIAQTTEAYPDGFFDSLGTNQDELAAQQALANLDDVQDDLGEAYYGNNQKAVIFKEQCFLLSFVGDIAGYKLNILDRTISEERAAAIAAAHGGQGGPRASVRKAFKRLPYVANELNKTPMERNSTLLLDGESYGFLNRLTQNPLQSRLHNILNHELSNLQPRLRLWKVIFDPETQEEVELEIKFDTHMTSTDLDIFETTAARGVGAGLKSFNFVYDGSNPFSVKKSIKGNLKVFANTFSELLRKRPAKYTIETGDVNNPYEYKTDTYTYVDLVMKTWNTAGGGGMTAADLGGSSDVGGECEEDINEENINKAELNFRLKAQIGLSYPPNQMSSMAPDLRAALQESYVTLNLTPTVHNFEIDEQGRVTMNINYLAYIEQFFDQKMFNVFANANVTKNRFAREFKMKNIQQSCSTEAVNQQKKDYAEVIETETANSISSLMTDMMTEDLIYYLNLRWSDIRDFLSYGPHHERGNSIAFGPGGAQISNNEENDAILKGRIEEAMAGAIGQEGTNEETEANINAALVGNSPEETDLSFFYLSDLIDLILIKIEKELEDVYSSLDTLSGVTNINDYQIAKKKKALKQASEGFKSLRILLGPVEFTHPKVGEDGNKSVFVNLGDVPISVKYFVGWLTNQMLKKDEIFYPLTKFINDLINNLVRNFLNNDECFGYSIKQKTRLNQSVLTSFSPSTEHDNITVAILGHAQAAAGSEEERAMAQRYRGSLGDFAPPILNLSGPDGARTQIPIANEFNYFVYFAGRTMPTELQIGHKESDEARGIFHYMLGRDRGLIKNIKLTKTQTKGLAEVRFEQEGYDGLEQLRVVYDAQIDMYTSVNTFPGTYIFIDPRGFAPDMPVGLPHENDAGQTEDPFGLTDLGIGGYYMIIRSEHEIAPGRANTILQAKWVAALDSDEGCRAQRMVDEGSGDGGRQSRNCSITVRPQETTTMEEDSGIPWVPFI